MPPVRVAILSCNLYPLLLGRDRGFGGAELDMYVLGSALAADPGFAVTAVTQTSETTKPFSSHGMHVIPVAPRPPAGASRSRAERVGRDLSYVLRLASSLWRVRTDVFLTEVASPQALLLLWVARLRRLPVVFRFGSDKELSPDSMADFCFFGSRRMTRWFLQALSHADRVLTQTEGQRKAVETVYGLPSEVVRNAHHLPPEPSLVRPEAPLLWLGRADAVKRPRLLLELARRLPQQRFVMVAPQALGQEAFFEQLRRESADLPNVEFIPGVPQKEAQAYFARARAFVLTSEAEGLPNVLIEALKSGTPVVSLAVNPDGLLREISGGEEGPQPAPGFCAGDNFEALPPLLERLCTDDSFWTACAQEARACATRLFDAEAILARYKEILRELTSK